MRAGGALFLREYARGPVTCPPAAHWTPVVAQCSGRHCKSGARWATSGASVGATGKSGARWVTSGGSVGATLAGWGPASVTGALCHAAALLTALCGGGAGEVSGVTNLTESHT